MKKLFITYKSSYVCYPIKAFTPLPVLRCASVQPAESMSLTMHELKRVVSQAVGWCNLNSLSNLVQKLFFIQSSHRNIIAHMSCSRVFSSLWGWFEAVVFILCDSKEIEIIHRLFLVIGMYCQASSSQFNASLNLLHC